MRYQCIIPAVLILTVVVLEIGPDLPAQDLEQAEKGAKADRDLLQGTWICETAVEDGKDAPKYLGILAVIDGDNLTWHYPRENHTYFVMRGGQYSIDASKDPKHFDQSPLENPAQIDRRLYSVTQDELRWSTNLDARTTMTRPQSLDSGKCQFTMKRVRNAPSLGTVLDPTGKCELRRTEIKTGNKTGEKFRIRVPEGHYDLYCGNTPAEKLFNAPRVQRAVEGDFVAQVKVTSDWTLGERLPTGQDFNGAGMFVWDSEMQYIRLERTQFRSRSSGTLLWFTTPLYDLNGKRTAGWKTSPTEFFKGKSTWLRIERTGQTITSSISHDGKAWIETGKQTTQFPQRVQVGIHALNGCQRELVAEFEEFSIRAK